MRARMLRDFARRKALYRYNIYLQTAIVRFAYIVAVVKICLARIILRGQSPLSFTAGTTKI